MDLGLDVWLEQRLDGAASDIQIISPELIRYGVLVRSTKTLTLERRSNP